MIRLSIGLALFCFAFVGKAQIGGPINVPPGTTGVIDGVVMPSHIPTKKVVPYAHLREADYMWSKMTWRTIDLREKMNYALYYPLEPMNDRWNLFHILKSGIMSGNLTAYRPLDKEKFIITQIVDGDQFRYPILPPSGNGNAAAVAASKAAYDSERKEILNDCIEVDSLPQETGFDIYGAPIYDPKDLDQFGGVKIYKTTQCEPIYAQDIIEYHIKEEWFFDKQRSVMDVRIIGIAPVRYMTENGQVTGKRELFWVYFPEARYLLQNFFTFNEQNRARRMSFDDFFWKRKFQSYIDKEENVFDRTINDHKVGVDALLNAEEIKGVIFKFEHDLWHF